ncbi:DUF4162 domain-containing protein [Marinilactibacillus kalidii]|uniref:ATP-binding protein DrrA1-3 family domain-containing protein n=1 Tax=Marinilactibacillus kalidii TaxID=2820274 RepID=UPI001ABE21AA|nr:AAA family ATPase [Marinilactibacillus kalidii]
MKRKLDIAMSLVGSPEVIFLDEPTTGLDPQSRNKMWKIIKELKQSGVTIFLTTQYLEEAEQLADKIAILDNGVIIAEGTSEELKKYLPHGVVKFSFHDRSNLEASRELLKNFTITEALENLELTIFTDGTANTLAEIFHRLSDKNVNIKDFSKITPNLEDVFLAMITESEDNSNEK